MTRRMALKRSTRVPILTGEKLELVRGFKPFLDTQAVDIVHPAAGHETGTLVNALIAHCGASLSGIGGVRRPGIVHRLDKDTSGLMVVAKNDRAHQSLSTQFADHGRTNDMRRGYMAFVWGVPNRQRGTVEAPIDRHPHRHDHEGAPTREHHTRHHHEPAPSEEIGRPGDRLGRRGDGRPVPERGARTRAPGRC